MISAGVKRQNFDPNQAVAKNSYRTSGDLGFLFLYNSNKLPHIKMVLEEIYKNTRFK